MLEDITYTARVSYKVDGGTCTYKHEYFGNVESATVWAFERVSDIVIHWGEINPNGFCVSVIIDNSEGVFCDTYEIKCGF